MNTPQPTKKGPIFAIILVIALLITAGCGLPGAAAPTPTIAPTLAPSNTATAVPPTATSTIPPTATALPPTPTITPLPPTATPVVFIITDSKFKANVLSDCNTNATISGVEGDNFSVGGRISIKNGQWALWCYGAVHTWIGTLTYGGYTFASDAANPLTFQIDQNRGYVFIGGKGSVKSPDGKETSLDAPAAPSVPAAAVNTPAATEPAAASQPTQENQPASPAGSSSELVAQYLNGVTMGSKVAMNDTAWTMLGGVVSQNGGIMETGGTGINLAYSAKEIVAGNQGYLMTFKVIGATEYHIGLTDEGADKLGYEISGTETQVETFIYRAEKADSSFGKFTGTLAVEPDTFYKTLVAYAKDGTFLIVIWNDQNPGNVLVAHFKDDNDWWQNLDFEISTSCDKGKLFIQDVTLLSFSAIK